MSPFRALLTVTVWLVLMTPRSSAGTECVTITVPGSKPLTTQQWIAMYDLVFTGTVIRSIEDSTETVFVVDRVWRGRVKHETALVMLPTVMGFLEKGRSYLVMANRCRGCGGTEPMYDMGHCSPNRDLATAETQELLKQLGPGRPPDPK
jgi:hypothetical protein